MKKNGGRRFDIILSNPPYAQNLHLKFLEKYAELADTIISIQPIVWLNKNKYKAPIGKYRKLFNGRIDEIEYIDHRKFNDLFGTGNSLEAGGIFVLKKEGNLDLLNYGFKSEQEKNIYEKIDIFNNEHIITIHRCIKYCKSLEDIKDPYFVPIYTWHGGKDCYDAVVVSEERAKKKVGTYLKFNSEEEVKNFKESLKTQFMNFYYWNFTVPNDCKIKGSFFIVDDYSKPVTNETFYKIFNINKNEINFIENFKRT